MSPWFPAIWLALAPALQGEAALPALDVLLRDEVGVPTPVLVAARLAATRIFRAAGVEITWLDPAAARAASRGLAADEARAFLTAIHTVRVVADAAGDHRGVPGAVALGFTALDTRQATVRYRRIDQRARDAGVDVATVLGHVMVHELGHLLLGRAGHSAAGIMRASLDVPRAAQGRLLFSEADGRALRARAGDLIRSSIPLSPKALTR